jgi:hypothetical protein
MCVNRGPHRCFIAAFLRRRSRVPDGSDWPQPYEGEARDTDGVRTGEMFSVL